MSDGDATAGGVKYFAQRFEDTAKDFRGTRTKSTETSPSKIKAHVITQRAGNIIDDTFSGRVDRLATFTRTTRVYF